MKSNKNERSVLHKDINNPKKSEELIRKLSHAVQQSPSTVIITDIKGYIEYVNPKFTQVTGYSSEEVIGKNPRMLKSDKFSTEDYKQLWETIISGGEWRGEFHNKKKSGESYWESASISPIRNMEGVITHFVAVKEDITERKIAEKKIEYRLKIEKLITSISTNFLNLKLEKLDNKIKQTLQIIGNFVKVDRSYFYLFEDRDKKIKNFYEWSRKGIRSYNDRRQELSLFNLFSHEEYSTILPFVRRQERFSLDLFPWLKEKIENFEVIHVPRIEDLPPQAINERKALLEAGIKTFINVPMVAERYIVGFLGFDSISDEKIWSDEDIRLLKMIGEIFVNTIKREHAEKIVELQKQQIAQADKIISIGTLGAGMAHEINQPLTAISGFIQKLKRDLKQHSIEEATLEENLNKTSDQVNRIVSTIDRLRIFGRQEFMDMKEIDVGEILDNSLVLLKEKIRLKNIKLSQNIEEKLPMVWGNASKLEQVFANLIENAIDAFGKKTENIEIVVDISTSANEAIQIKITDNGCGIEESIQGKIFEPFFTTKKVGKGSGLGLSIAYGIVREHRGSITCMSAINKGTTFNILLPLEKRKKR